MEAFQVLGIAVGKAQQVVVRASDIEAVQDLRRIAHRLLEGFELRGMGALQVDDGEADAVLPHGLGIEQRHVLRDHARFLQLLDPAQAGRRRQMHLLRQVHIGQPAVTLQDFKNSAVYRIELRSSGLVRHNVRLPDDLDA